ncbi:MAG TPA: alpha/beta hydrolase [Polyangiales bacterium]|nr:alpha/beta hydrolase [Polyangiales bacterium]
MKDESFVSTVDGTKIFVRSWRPSGTPRALVVISHGFKAYGGLYTWTAEQLAKAGFVVYAHDHRGHGESGGDRYEATDIQHFVTDLDHVVDLAKSRDPGLQTFLLGHSAGGVIGCVYALEHQEKLAGFVCESYAFGVYVPALGLQALKGLSHVAPHLHVVDVKNKLFSRDPKVVAALDHDPLIPQINYPAGTVAAMVRGTERIRAEFAKITLPVLIVHGSEDKVTEPAGSKLFFESTGAKDKTLKIYDGYYHDLLADEGREVPLADIQAWFEARISVAPVVSA